LELNQHRVLRLRLLSEVQADRWLRQLRLACGVQVDIEHEIIARVETPGHGRLDHRTAAGFPEQEVTVGIESVARDHKIHARESFARNFLLPADRSRAVDEQIRMVDASGMAG